MNLADFLGRFGPAIADAVIRTYPPLYDGEMRRTCGFDVRHLLRRPIGAQADAIRATALSLQQHAGTIVVGEMGVGKTLVAAAAAHLAGFRRVLVLVPPHLVKKWQREVLQTVPGARATIVRRIGDLNRVRLAGGRMQFVICSREQAKLGYRWMPAAVLRPARDELGGLTRDEAGQIVRLVCCPTCFAPVADEEQVPLRLEDLEAKKHRCPACGGPLWQADRTGPRRFPLADYIRHRMAGYFDLLIADECFPAGTRIATPSGWRPIEQLRVGDRVLSYRDGIAVERTIVRTIRKPLRQPLVRVSHERGCFTCTPNHRIYSASGSFVEAGQLRRGTPLVLLNLPLVGSVDSAGGSIADHQEAVPPLSRELHLLAAPPRRAAVLRTDMRGPSPRRQVEAPEQDGSASDDERVLVVRGVVRIPSGEAAKVLQQALFSAGTHGHDRLADTHRCPGTCEDTTTTGGSLGSHATPQQRPGDTGEVVRDQTGPHVLRCAWWEWLSDASAKGTADRAGVACGAFYPDGTEIMALCEGGPRRANAEDSRGGRPSVASHGEAAQPRRSEDSDASRSWLDRAALLELGDRPGPFRRDRQDSGCGTSAALKIEWLKSREEFVYDLEVEDTHCYFADGVLVSNCHEYKARGSAQGLAAGALASVCGKALTLTGTIFGGYSSTLFYLLWRFSPAARTEFGYRDESKWVGRYGVIERITKKDPDAYTDDGRHSKRRSYLTRTVEKPGVSPAVLFHLIGNTVFLRLADVAQNLPTYTERVVLLPLEAGEGGEEPSQASCYRRLATDLWQAVAGALQQGSKRLLATYLQALLSYPDACTKGETVVDAETGNVIAHAPALPTEALYPKERALVDLVGRERARGRRVLVFITHTESRDISPRLRLILEREGFRVAVLKAATISADRREEWVAARVREGADVLICHPRLVQTGLDLVDWPSVVWFEPEYSVYVLRQASRRSWRIGQRHPVEVTYLIYEGTLQAEALALVAAKMRSSLMIEGELPEEGLAALEGDGQDVFLALARRLTEQDEGQEQSLEALFAQTRAIEAEAEDYLVDGAWETPAAPSAPTPEGSFGDGGVDLWRSVFTGEAPTDEGVGDRPDPGDSGRVVSFEELALLGRRPKPRRKPVPEGQLALFDR